LIYQRFVGLFQSNDFEGFVAHLIGGHLSDLSRRQEGALGRCADSVVVQSDFLRAIAVGGAQRWPDRTLLGDAVVGVEQSFDFVTTQQTDQFHRLGRDALLQSRDALGGKK
jgi:hypothetical protein